MITHAYVRYVDDNALEVVSITNIRDFHPSGPKDFSDTVKYNVKWSDQANEEGEYYKARILLLGVSEEDVRSKLCNGRLRVRRVIDSSDNSEEDPSVAEKENSKSQKKHMKEKASNCKSSGPAKNPGA
ncbi:unnamed protein product [Ixodes hexagonus]